MKPVTETLPEPFLQADSGPKTIMATVTAKSSDEEMVLKGSPLM